MARRYINLTLLYRVNIQRKNSVSRKRQMQSDPAVEAAQSITLPVPSTTQLPAGTTATVQA